MALSYVNTAEMNMPFTGAKIVLLLEGQVVTILRDDRSDIPYPAYWDLPGGGREGGETPIDCALRETHEELGLRVPHDAIFWGRRFCMGDQASWFFVARVPPGTEQQIVFGDEGQCWKLMDSARFLLHARVVPHFQRRFGSFLEDQEEKKNPPLV